VSELDLEHELDELLAMMRETRGSDFTGYKRSTLQRRVKRRMILLDLATFGEYKDYLELQPEEFGQLFDSLLINVTSFFRDPLAWQALQEQVLPELFSAKGVKTPIRVWSAGCATGEEAYTLAIVLAEGPRARPVPGAGEDLRDRPRPGRVAAGARRSLRRQRARRCAGEAQGYLFRAGR